MTRAIIATALVGIGALGLAGCDVQKTQNGQMPSVNVSGGQMPEFNVTGPDVNVGSKTETIKVPTVNVKTGSERKAEGH